MATARATCLDSLKAFLEKAERRYAESAATPREEPPAVASPPGNDGRDLQGLTLSEVEEAWAHAESLFREGQIVRGIVTGWNRGGLLVRCQRLQGFVPASQLKVIPCSDDPEARDRELAKWVGEELPLKVIELDRSRNRLVFSERATIWGPRDSAKLLESIVPGETQWGYVSNLCDFGAFVDLGGVDGLIHVSELSWGRVNHPSELLKIGQHIAVHVISVDRENRRVALSLKRLHPDPWSTVDEKYQVGQVLEAVISNVVDFGAFARIGDGLEGLIHVSEFPDGVLVGPVRPAALLAPGQRVRVRIVRIDSANHRLGLSLRLSEGQRPSDSAGESGQADLHSDDAEDLLY